VGEHESKKTKKGQEVNQLPFIIVVALLHLVSRW
jgi:hypothetical protein